MPYLTLASLARLVVSWLVQLLAAFLGSLLAVAPPVEGPLEEVEVEESLAENKGVRALCHNCA